MSDLTRILSAIDQGDPHAADQLLPLVYDEFRRRAGEELTHEAPGQTLYAMAPMRGRGAALSLPVRSRRSHFSFSWR